MKASGQAAFFAEVALFVKKLFDTQTLL